MFSAYDRKIGSGKRGIGDLLNPPICLAQTKFYPSAGTT